MDFKALTDEQLMAGVAKGGMDELGELVYRHQEKVLALAYRTLGHWDLAEDVCQETFIRVYKSAKRYRPTAKLTTWLYRIVVNLCLDERRRAKRSPAELSNYTNQLAPKQEDDPLDKQMINEKKRLVWEALANLNKRERLSVVLHRFHGMSHSEVAKVTGWSQSAVESLLVRSYQKLREQLKEFKENDR